MNLPASGREYAKITVSAPDGATLAVSFDDGASWHTPAREGDVISVLVAGPTAVNSPANTATLALGHNPTVVRLTAGSEDVRRSAGSIYVS